MPGPGYEFFGEEERREILDVLDTRQILRYRLEANGETQPSKTYLFEREIERQFVTSHCLAVNSGTSALLAGLMALGIQAGDEIIVPGYTFIASIASIVYARAVPVLAEIDDSLSLDPADVARKITSRTKAIMAVHMLGSPCQMEALRSLALEHGVALIEDVAQACGGSYRGRSLGTWGHVGAFSLNIFKTITSGDGGFMITDDKRIYETAFAFHDHGFRPFRNGVVGADSIFGLNLRMSEFNGAVALAQARKLPTIVERVRAQKHKLVEAIGTCKGITRRHINDPDGDVGTVLVYLFPNKVKAETVANSLGTKTLQNTGYHYYASMPQLLTKRLPYINGCPFSCEAVPSGPTYAPGMLPRTDDILSRAIALTVGVRDSYLGAAFGIHVLATDDEISVAARTFRRSLLNA